MFRTTLFSQAKTVGTNSWIGGYRGPEASPRRDKARSASQRHRLQADSPLLLTHAHFDHIFGIPGLFSTLGLRQSGEELLTVHGGPDTLDVVVRMLAGLWGEGRAPIR